MARHPLDGWLSMTQAYDNHEDDGGGLVGRAAGIARAQLELWKYCARRLHMNNVMAMSAALSFRTIFALIPTLVLAFLVLKSMGVVEDGKQVLRNFLDTSGFSQLVAVPSDNAGPDTPPTGEPVDETGQPVQVEDGPTGLEDDDASSREVDSFSVADKIVELVDDVEQRLSFTRLGPIGALLLVWTSMTLLMTIEASLNRIFEAPGGRPFLQRMVLFWSVITLGPVLLVAAAYLGNSAVSTFARIGGVAWVAATVGWLMPPLVAVLVVGAGYRLIPNTHVKFSAAITGALVAVPAWMVAKWVFAFYVERFVLRGNLYGVLGLLPLFLLWLNVSWSILLFGAELAHTASNLSRLRSEELAEKHVLGLSDWFAVAVAIARPFRDGEGLVSFETIVEKTELPAFAVRSVLERMIAGGVVFGTGDDEPRYGLYRPSDKISLEVLTELADPRGRVSQSGGNDIRRAVADAQEPVRSALASRTVAELIEKAGNGVARHPVDRRS